MCNFAAELKDVANKEKLVDIQWNNTFYRSFLKSNKKARYKLNLQSAYFQVFALSLTFKRLSKISLVPIKAVERRYYVDCRWCIENLCSLFRLFFKQHSNGVRTLSEDILKEPFRSCCQYRSSVCPVRDSPGEHLSWAFVRGRLCTCLRRS